MLGASALGRLARMIRGQVLAEREKEGYTHLNAEFQRIARRDKKALLSDQCKDRGKQQNGISLAWIKLKNIYSII